MKKNTTVVKQEAKYETSVIINNTALIFLNNKSGLLNIKTNKIVGEIGHYNTTYDTKAKTFIQTSELEKGTRENDWHSRYNIRIYDALNEIMLMDGWELIKKYDEYNSLMSAKDPTTGKLHLYDKYTLRKTTNIFDIPLDDIDKLYTKYNDTFLVLTKNGKKALYFHNSYDKVPQLITPFDNDNIELIANTVVFTKGNKKCFVTNIDDDVKDIKTSQLYDNIWQMDEENYILYAKQGNNHYVYNTYSKDLIAETECDEIECLVSKKDNSYYYNAAYYFLVKKDNKYGILYSEINNEIRKNNDSKAKMTVLLQPVYDEIEYDRYYTIFYLKIGDRVGLFTGNSYHNKTIEPQYDDIDALGNYTYALHTGDVCEIGKFTAWEGYKCLDKNCKIEKRVNYGIIYRKYNGDDREGGKLGIIYQDSDYNDDILPAKYDKIEKIEDHYFMIEKSKLKGIIHFGEIIIPAKYKNIAIGKNNSDGYSSTRVIYFALKRKDNKYELAKRHDYSYRSSNKDSPVEFVTNHDFDNIKFLKDIMVFKDSKYTYIYDYDEKLLKTLSPDATITQKKEKEDSYYRSDKRSIYNIDGVYYFYKDGKFEEVHFEMNDCYVTTYEIDSTIFEIKTFDKREHDAFCKEVEEKNDEEAKKFLTRIVGNGRYGNYPSITVTTRSDEDE